MIRMPLSLRATRGSVAISAVDTRLSEIAASLVPASYLSKIKSKISIVHYGRSILSAPRNDKNDAVLR